MTLIDMQRLVQVAELEFGDIVTETFPGINELRLILIDGSVIDVWFSLKLRDRYSYHWERRALDGTIYRHDNAPHRRWRSVATFPKHYHEGSEDKVLASHLSAQPEEALRQFPSFARIRMS